MCSAESVKSLRERCGQTAVLHVRHVAQERRAHDDQAGQLRRRVAVVVEDADRRRRADGVAVQVGEHLLAAVQADVDEHDDGDRLVAESRVLGERRWMAARRCCPSLITKVADIGMVRVPTRSVGAAAAGQRLEAHLGVHAGA